MGSFAYTCALSDLPIHAGDACRVVAMVPSLLGLNGGACSRMALAFPPVKGVYDDYGYLEDLAPTAFQEELASRMGLGSVDSFIEKLKDGEAEAMGGRAAPVFSLVLEEAWQSMLAMPGTLHDSEYNDHDARPFMAQACSEGARFFSKAPEALAKDKAGAGMIARLGAVIAESNSSESDRSAMTAKWLLQYCMADEMDKAPCFKSALGYYFENSLQQVYAGMDLARFFTMWSLDGATAEELRAGLDEIGEQILVNMNMNMLRKVWLERDSSGPQFGEHALHWLWAQKLSAISEAQIDWTDDENGSYCPGFREAKSIKFKTDLEMDIPIPDDARLASAKAL